MNGLALITGGSEGIGFAIAQELLARGISVVLVARHADKLAAAAEALERGIGHHSEELKVFTEMADVTRIGDRLRLAELYGDHITILVNNAGIGHHGFVADQSFEEQMLPLIETNCTALVHLSRLFLPLLEPRGGTIVNISSILSAFPGPKYALYGASKAFVTSFSEALRTECRLKGSSVSVLTVLPSTTHTAFFAKADMPSQGVHGTAPEAVAKGIVRAIFQRQAFYFPTFQGYALLFFSRLLGWRISSALFGRFY